MSNKSFLKPCRPVLLTAALAVAGCGTVSDGTPQPPPPVAPLHLEINNARGMEHVNGTLLVTVQTEGGTPDRVELLRNGRLLATMLPPFQFAWDTTVEEEGVHQLQARALWKGHSFTSEEHPVSVDRTGPSVIDVFPLGANVAWGEAATLRATFSEPVRIQDMQRLRVHHEVNSGGATSHQVGLSEDGRTLTASVGASYWSLPSNGRAAVSLEGISDLAGNPAPFNPYLGPTFIWTWTVPAFTVAPELSFPRPPQASAPANVSGRPVVAMAPGGAMVVAYADAEGLAAYPEAEGGHHIVVGRLEGGTWSLVGTPFNVDESAVFGWRRVSSPLLAVGADGRPVVAFQQRDLRSDEGPTLHVFRWSEDSTWEPLGSRLNAPGAGGFHAAALTLDSEGRPVVAWSSTEGVHVRRWESEQWVSLGDVQRVGTGPEATVSEDAPALSADGAGGVFLAWAETLSHDAGAGMYARHWTGSHWAPMGGRLVYAFEAFRTQHATEPAMATGPDGQPVLVWAEWRLAGMFAGDVMVARWSGTEWTLKPEGRDLSHHSDMRRWPSVAVDGAGRVVVTFFGSASYPGIYTTWLNDGPYQLSHVRTGASLPSSLALDAEGRPVVVWNERSRLQLGRPNE